MQRNRLPWLVVAAAVLAVLLIGVATVAPIGAQNPDDSADRTISIDAVGDATAPPDQAVVRVAVTAEGDEPGAVRDDLAEGAEGLRESFADAGVDADAYETSEYRIREPRRHPDDRAEHAYEGVHAFEVTLDDPDRAGMVIDAATDADARIGNVEFTLSDDREDELREDAIADAMADARVQADAIADSGDLVVTSVAEVDASQQHYRPVRYDAAVPAQAEAGGASTSIETGDVSVSYRVQVTYNATAA